MNALKYIDSLKKSGFNIDIVKDIIKDYGTINVKGEFNWNHRIDGFWMSENKLMISVYWQGDSTDGNDSVSASGFLTRDTVTIPAVTFFDGYRTRETHSDLHITRDELKAVVPAIIEWLSPENIQARETQRKREKAYKKVKDYMKENLVPKFKRYDEWKYVKNAFVLNQYIYNNAIELAKLSNEELEARLWEKFKNPYINS